MPTRTELFAAAKTGDVATFERFFAEPATLEAALAVETRISEYVRSELWPRHAATARSLGLYDAWLYDDDRNYHIFNFAVKHRQYAVVAWLVTSRLSTALHSTLQYFLVDAARTAVLVRDVYIVELLLTSRAWVTYPDHARPDALSTLLSAAIQRLSPAILTLLSTHGADVTRCLDDQRRPLHHAAARDPSSAFAFVLRDLGAVTVGERNVLHLAASCGYHGAIAGLVALGVDCYERDERLATALHRAASYGEDTTVAALLTHTCIDLDARNQMGATALNVADQLRSDGSGEDSESDSEVLYDERTGKQRTIEMLLQHGAAPDS